MTEKPYIKEHFPLLAEIDSPADLRKLKVEDLPAVCDQLRGMIIHELSSNPGHFASSMGAVEIVVALHYVFDTPSDRIVWDVGHQAYAHKILTGRRDLFSENRKFGGLSGFPNPNESEYDTFMSGHASNSISAALGMSIASALSGDPTRKVVAVIGDASIGGGLAFEGLNNASNNPNNLLIILNDNDMSIDNPVGALGEYMTNLTTSRGYNNFRYKTYNYLRRHGVIGDSGKGVLLRFNNAMKSLLTGQQNIFEGLNVRYFGPFDGHDVKRLVKLFAEVKDMTGPKLIHLHTVKGKGYAPEADPTTWHAPGKFNEETGERLRGNYADKPPKYQDVFGETLVELARADERVVGITAAMPGGTSMSKMLQAFPSRTFDVGISEGHGVTFAGGLANEGYRPFVAIYSSFLQRAYDHIIHDVAMAGLPVTFCIDRGGLVGEDGITHHGLFDLAYLRCIPGMTVAAPIDERDLRRLMYTALTDSPGPMAIRYPRGASEHVDWRCPLEQLPIGRGRCLAEGERVAVLSVGTIGNNVARAVARLHAEGLNAAHYDMIFVKPLDTDLLRQAAARCDRLVTVEDGTTVGGLGTAVAEWVASNGVSARVTALGVADRWVDQGTVGQQQKLCGIDEESIYETVKKLFEQPEQ